MTQRGQYPLVPMSECKNCSHCGNTLLDVVRARMKRMHRPRREKVEVKPSYWRKKLARRFGAREIQVFSFGAFTQRGMLRKRIADLKGPVFAKYTERKNAKARLQRYRNYLK